MTDSPRQRFDRIAFIALVALTGYLAYQVLSPFVAPLAWASVFAILLEPVHARLSVTRGPTLAAVLTTLLVVVVFVVPAAFVISMVAREAPQIINRVQGVSLTPYQIERVWDVVRERSPVPLPDDPVELLRQGVTRAVAFLVPRAGAFVADLVATIGQVIVMLFTLFFFLRDGHAIARRIADILPLPTDQALALIRETRDLVNASVGAGLVVAVTQGAVGGLAYWALGFAAPAIWGVSIAIASLMPLVGAALVWVPTAIWLFLAGEFGRGLVMLIVGALGISMVDNILRPILLSGKTSVNGLVIFLGLLGGVGAFGFIGLIVGPIVLVLADRLLEIWTRPEERSL
ncbi:MAG TPA: AI-2E family transporter [Vicinamibacterales bacterium]|jgi:predicted PurR-regulated permease PerM